MPRSRPELECPPDRRGGSLSARRRPRRNGPRRPVSSPRASAARVGAVEHVAAAGGVDDVDAKRRLMPELRRVRRPPHTSSLRPPQVTTAATPAARPQRRRPPRRFGPARHRWANDRERMRWSTRSQQLGEPRARRRSPGRPPRESPAAGRDAAARIIPVTPP